MLKSIFKIACIVLVASLLVNCANRGRPSGGEKDTEAPRIVKSVPENFSTNFKASEIKIYFNEFIKIKDAQRQLIISPPMEYEPDITPLGSPSKFIKIKILDTLKPNTTYAFNFGQSIVDNNEENPYSYYKYVFSTGNDIDSLSVKGQVFDALNRSADKFVSVMLYEVDSTYTDSIVYKQKPKYITNTLDSTTTFSLENLKAGRYRLIALKDENNNYTYQQKTDKIGFYNQEITLPTDSIYSLKLFNEELDFKAIRAKQISGQKVVIGFEGDYNGTRIDILEDVPEAYQTRLTKDVNTDSLYYWYKPEFDLDSTLLVVKNKTYTHTLTHRFKTLEKDSLIVRALQTGIINFQEDFTIIGSVPFTNIKEERISIINQDSIKVPFTTVLDSMSNTYAFKFKKEEDAAYEVQILPDALTDFFGNTNDSLNYQIQTRRFADYGSVRVNLNNAVYPVIVQLTNSKGELKYEQFADKPQPFDFKNIEPNTYYLRVAFDVNGNKKWDSGNYLKKIQPERMSYDPDAIEVRAGWDWIEEFTLE